MKRVASEATISPAASPAKRPKEAEEESDAFTSLMNHSASAPSSTAGTKRVASLLDRPTLVMRPVRGGGGEEGRGQVGRAGGK